MPKQPTIIRAISQTRASDDTYEFVISDESVDRHGTVILASAWNVENYNRNGIVAYMHDAHNRNDVDKIIGKGSVRQEGGQLIGTIEFESVELTGNELADKIRRKIDFGSLSATSVGFIPKSGHWGDEERSEDPDIYYFDDVELIEFSIVNIPSNPNAVKRDAGLGDYLSEHKKQDDNEDKDSSKALALVRSRILRNKEILFNNNLNR